MEDQLIHRIKKMRQELMALKTAHKRGLGLIDFYRKTTSWTYGGSALIQITATAKSGSPTPFFCQLASSNEAGIADCDSLTINGNVMEWTVWAPYNVESGENLVFEAISSVELASLTVKAGTF